MFEGIKSIVSVINLDCRILGEARFYAREVTATFLNFSSQGLLPKGLRCFVYFGNLFYVWVFISFVLFIYVIDSVLSYAINKNHAIAVIIIL